MVLNSRLGTRLVEGRTLGCSWLVVSHVSKVCTWSLPVTKSEIRLFFVLRLRCKLVGVPEGAWGEVFSMLAAWKFAYSVERTISIKEFNVEDDFSRRRRLRSVVE